MANQMIHHGGPCRDDLQAVCACAVSLEKSAPAVIDVLARQTFEIMLGLHLVEQRQRDGYSVHEIFI
jgi:hypothetical protein